MRGFCTKDKNRKFAKLKVSIVTATYNSSKTVEDTIKSILIQTYKEYEYIIIDGISKDITLDIARKYEPFFEGRMHIYCEKDEGIYDAMNKGIEASTGDIVGILNSDDLFTSDDVIAKVAKTFADDESIDAVYGDIHFVKDNNLNKCTRYFTSRYFRPWMLRFGFMPAHPSFYCKKSLFEKYGLYDLQYRTSSDFEMMVRLLWKHKIKTKYLNMDFVTMRAGGESTAGVASKKKVNNDISRTLKAYGIYSNQAMQALRYVWRLGELIYTRIKCKRPKVF